MTIEIDDTLIKYQEEIDEIRNKYKTTPIKFLIDSSALIAGLILVVASFIKLNELTTDLVKSLVELAPNEETITANINKIGIILGGYGVLETAYWGILATGIALLGIGIAWYIYRISERNNHYMNEINRSCSSALSEMNYKMLSSIHNEIQDIKNQMKLGKG